MNRQPDPRLLLAADEAKVVYLRAYEKLAEQAQIEMGAGMTKLAEITQTQAEIAMRAYRAEDT